MAVNCSENLCQMKLIISQLVQDEQLLMKYLGVYFIYLW